MFQLQEGQQNVRKTREEGQEKKQIAKVPKKEERGTQERTE